MNLEFIKFIKETVYHCFKTDLGTNYKYLIKDILPLNYNLVVVHCYDFKYHTEQITELKYPGKYTHELKLLLDTTAELILEHKETRLIIKKRKHFSLDVYCTFNPETEYFSFSLLDKNQVVLNQYYDLVYESYKDLKIGSLVDNDYKINDESAVAFFTRITRINKSIKNDFFCFTILAE
jgi:hypothetical protein